MSKMSADVSSTSPNADPKHASLQRKPSDQFSIEDIIYEMQSRPSANAAAGSAGNAGANGLPNPESGVFSEESGTAADMYAQLEQKERDLVLAAELGKALLDKNEELSKQNELIAEEFSLKLEVRHAFYCFSLLNIALNVAGAP